MWRSTRVPIHCDSIHAAALFQGSLRSAIHEFKYNKQPFLAKSCAAVMLPFARGLPVPDLVIPVPLSRKRLRERRYNQSALLARQLAKALDVSLADDVVGRMHADMNQVGLDAKARWENVKSQFTVLHTAIAQIKDRRILLVDDVITTGATLNALAQILKKSGAASVHALTLGQTV